MMDRAVRKILAAGLCVLGLCLFSAGGFAQENVRPDKTAARKPVAIPQAIPQTDGTQIGGYVPYVKGGKIQGLENEIYDKPTYENLSKLYWTLGILDPDKDIDAIDNFVRINDCQVFLDYFQDDFEWRKIRNLTKERILKERINWPRRYELLVPIELGRYSFDKKSFPVLSEFIRDGARRITTGYNSTQVDICGARRIAKYPRDIVLNLSRPILIEEIPIEPDLAQDYLIRTKLQNTEVYRGKDPIVRERKYERVAYVRIRVRLIKFMEFSRVTTEGELYPIIFASTESFDVFEDQSMKKILFSSNLKPEDLPLEP